MRAPGEGPGLGQEHQGMESGEVETHCGPANNVLCALGQFLLNLSESIFPSMKVGGENSS